MKLKLDSERQSRLIGDLQAFFLDELDQEITEFRAEQILEVVLSAAAPEIYNQAIQDARKFIQDKLDDLEANIYVPPSK